MDGEKNAADELTRALEAARDGDPSALFEAAERLRPYLKRVVANVLRERLGGKVDTSDVVQQGLLASVERFEQFQGATAAEWNAWLVTICRNEARNLLRYFHQDRRNVAREKAVEVGASQLSVAGPVRLAGRGPTPSHQVALRQEASRLLEAIDRLPGEHRELLQLRHFDGLSHGEIAARTGRSEAAVRQLWVRALRQLRGQLGEAA